jgi:hypothetical protein
MATISGTIKDYKLLGKDPTGKTLRETWLLAVNFGTYSASADTAALAAVGAAIKAQAKDGKTRTLVAAHTMYPGTTVLGVAAYFTAATLAALTISTDDLTGELSIVDYTETDFTATTGMGVLVTCDVS